MINIERLKALSGVQEPSHQDSESNVSKEAAREAHGWVKHNINQKQMEAAVWGLFMAYETSDLAKLHRQFKHAEAQTYGDIDGIQGGF